MALSIYFNLTGMTSEKYAAVHEELEAIGQGAPQGRSFHCGFRAGEGVHVFDVWDSQEDFDAFGEHLMPILASKGIDPGQPMVAEVQRIIVR